MPERNDFRIVNEFEKSIILNSLDKICQNSDIFIKNYQERLYISFDRTSSRGVNPSIYLVSPAHPKFIEKFDKDIQITSIGLYFGFFNKESFRLSLEGAEYLAKNEDCFKEQILVVNSKGEKSILYGNDIYKEEVLKLPTKLRIGDILIVYNSLNEICVISQAITNTKAFKNLKPKSKIALNLADKGYYLRTKQ